MEHVKALLIKFVVTFALLYIILGLMYEMTFGEVFLLSAVLGIASYLIGDLLILPRTDNTIATIADFVLAGLIIYWFTDMMTVSDNVFTATLIATVGVSLFEIFFHRYMQNNILRNNSDNPATRNLQYQTEVSEELGEAELDDKHENNPFKT